MATIIGTRRMQLFVDGDQFDSDAATVALTSADTDADFVSYADALAGGARMYKLKLKIRQDTDTTSLWYLIWSRLGEDVPIIFWPNGGSPTEGATTPKFTGTATIREPDGDYLGGESNASSTAVNVVEVEWPFTAKPVLDITP